MTGRIAACALWLAFSCAPEAAGGPEAVHWDRDTCARCGMVISDPHYAAQIRLEDARRAEHFDDLGCALLWLDERGADATLAREIWVRAADGDDWLDARTAHYETGHRTPMAFGLAAVAGGSGAFDLASARAAVRELEDERRSAGR